MKPSFISFLTKLTPVFVFWLNFGTATAQDTLFWDKVRIGGNVALGFGSGYTDVTLAPGAIYRFNDYTALGAGLLGSYVHQRGYYDSKMYGGSCIVMFNPLPELQLSAELEQLRVNLDLDDDYVKDASLPYRHRDFWNPALFFGVGYSDGAVTAGLRYNVLYNKKDYVYSDALMPFVRVYF